MSAEYSPYDPPASDPSVQGTMDVLARHLEGIQFPLRFRFRVLTFVPKMDVFDAVGRPVLHARQRFFRLREQVEIFTDASQRERLAEIRADRIIDWSARYRFTDGQGGEIGAMGRRGWRSLWRANYEVFNPGDASPDFRISEENPMAKVMDGLFGGLPLLGVLTVWLFHPRYAAVRSSGAPALRLSKRPAFWEGRFDIEQQGPLAPREVMNLLLSFIMLVLLERRRG